MSKPTTEQVVDALQVLVWANGGSLSGNMVSVGLGNGVVFEKDGKFVTSGSDNVARAILEQAGEAVNKVVVLSQGQSSLIRRSAKTGERCANQVCVWHDVDILVGYEVIDVNGTVYCNEECYDEATVGD